MENPNGDECSNAECVNKPMWGGATPVMNWNNYITKGIHIDKGDCCARIIMSGRIEGTCSECDKKRSFLCMSECTTRPKCPDPPALEPAEGIRLWDGKTADYGKKVRYG